MADLARTPGRPARGGVAVTDATTGATLANDSFFIPNNGKLTILVKNSHASAAAAVTIATPVTVDGLAVADRTVAVAAGEVIAIGDLDPRYYNGPDAAGSGSGHVQVSIGGTPTASDIEVYLVQSV